MKKLVVMVLLVALYAFGAACTAPSVEEDDYDNGIQLIDKDDIQLPDERGTNDPQDPKDPKED